MNQLDAVFSSLGDPTRRAIIARLASGEMPLSKLAEPFEMSQTGVSKHVRVLSEAGLVHVEKLGRTRICRLEPAHMKEALDWLSEYQKFWTSRLDALERILAEDNDSE